MSPAFPNREYALAAFMTPLPGKVEELQQVLEGLAARIHLESGCLQATLSRALGEDEVLTLFTLWKDAPALARFRASDSLAILMGASGVLSAPAQRRFLAGSVSDGPGAPSECEAPGLEWSPR